MCMYIIECVCAPICTYVCLGICVRACVCVRKYTIEHNRMFKYAHMYMCACVRVGAWVFTCLFIFLYICVSVINHIDLSTLPISRHCYYEHIVHIIRRFKSYVGHIKAISHLWWPSPASSFGHALLTSVKTTVIINKINVDIISLRCQIRWHDDMSDDRHEMTSRQS